MKEANRYFLGSNSKYGFRSIFREILDSDEGNRLYIIKGGPGSGKSTLMKRVAEKFLADGDEVEIFPCSSDPDSLDGVLSKTKGVAMCDGTAPHIMDAAYPGAFETVINTGDGFDIKRLSKFKKAIKDINAEIAGCHARATEYIKAAALLREQSFNTAKEFINEDAVQTLADILPYKKRLKSGGKQYKRLLSAVTVGRIALMDDTLCNQSLVYGINDPYGAAADRLLLKIKEHGDAVGAETVTCSCSIIPEKTEHLIFPEASTAFTTVNAFHRFISSDMQMVDSMYMPFSEEVKSRLDFEQRTAKQLIERAAAEVKSAKEKHDILEGYYISAMDFSVVDRLYDKIVSETAHLE